MGETDDEPEQPEHNLAGGVANAGSVVRVGDHVLRPSNPHTPAIHAFLRALRDAGFAGASEPVGIDDDGRERLVFIDGDVPVPPYPEWAQSDTALAATATLMADELAAEMARVGTFVRRRVEAGDPKLRRNVEPHGRHGTL